MVTTTFSFKKLSLMLLAAFSGHLLSAADVAVHQHHAGYRIHHRGTHRMHRHEQGHAKNHQNKAFQHNTQSSYAKHSCAKAIADKQIADDYALACKLQQEELLNARKEHAQARQIARDAAYAKMLQHLYDQQVNNLPTPRTHQINPQTTIHNAPRAAQPTTATPVDAVTLAPATNHHFHTNNFVCSEQVVPVLWQTGPTCGLHAVKNASIIAQATQLATKSLQQDCAHAANGSKHTVSQLDKARRSWSKRMHPQRQQVDGTWTDEVEYLLKDYLKIDPTKYAILPPHGFLQKRKELLRKRCIYGHPGIEYLGQAIINLKRQDKAILPFITCEDGHSLVIAVHKDTQTKKLNFFVVDSGDGGRSHISKYKKYIEHIKHLLNMSDAELKNL